MAGIVAADAQRQPLLPGSRAGVWRGSRKVAISQAGFDRQWGWVLAASTLGRARRCQEIPSWSASQAAQRGQMCGETGGGKCGDDWEEEEGQAGHRPPLCAAGVE